MAESAPSLFRRLIPTLFRRLIPLLILLSPYSARSEHVDYQQEVFWPTKFEDCYNDTLWERMNFSELDPEIYGYDIFHYSIPQNCSNYLRKKPDHWFILGVGLLFLLFAGFLLTFSFRFKRRRNFLILDVIDDRSVPNPLNTSPPSYVFHRSYLKKDQPGWSYYNDLPTYEEALSRCEEVATTTPQEVAKAHGEAETKTNEAV